MEGDNGTNKGQLGYKATGSGERKLELATKRPVERQSEKTAKGQKETDLVAGNVAWKMADNTADTLFRKQLVMEA